MTKDQILSHQAYRYISNLSMNERYSALFGNTKESIEKNFGVKIQERSYAHIGDIPDTSIAFSCKDPFKDYVTVAELIPSLVNKVKTVN